VVERQ
jgi:hypothetical protein